MAVLEIRKKTSTIWTHTKAGQEVILSSGFFRIINDNFELTEPSGVDQFNQTNRLTPVTDVSVYDETSSGTEETFVSGLALATRLKALNYPFFNTASGGSGAVETTTEAFTAAFKTDKIYYSTGANEGTQTAVINFTVNNTDAIINGGVVKDITSNGETWNFSADFGSIATGLTLVDNQIIPDDAVKYRLIGYWNGSKMDVSVLELQTVNFIPQLNAPVLSTATTGDAFEIDITFTDTNSSPNDTGVAVYYREDGDTTWILHGTTAADATSYTLDNLTPDEDYNVSLIAVGSSGVSNNSSRSNILTATAGNYDYVTDLVASYRFSADADDYTTNHDLTPSNITYGGSDYAIFNGSSSTGTTADSDDFSFLDGVGDLPFTLSFWYYPDNNSGTKMIIQKDDNSSNREWSFYHGSTVLNFTLFTDGSNYLRVGISAISVTTWVHITITYDGSGTAAGLKAYKDSVEVSSAVEIGTYTGMSNTTAPLYVGTRNGSSLWLDGRLKRLHIWKDRELTSDEIDNMYTLENADTDILP